VNLKHRILKLASQISPNVDKQLQLENMKLLRVEDFQNNILQPENNPGFDFLIPEGDKIIAIQCKYSNPKSNTTFGTKDATNTCEKSKQSLSTFNIDGT
jgi:hypothetical protein